MVPPAPDAGTSGALALQSNRVSVGDGLRCRETGFPGRRKKRQYVPRATDQRSQRRSGRSKPRRFGAFRTPAGNLRECGTAWWAREDSNLQPDRYERRYFIGNIDKIWCFSSRQPKDVHDRLRPIVGEALVGCTPHRNMCGWDSERHLGGWPKPRQVPARGLSVRDHPRCRAMALSQSHRVRTPANLCC
jgi:hypothetical protein